jgi:hypothetical protein
VYINLNAGEHGFADRITAIGAGGRNSVSGSVPVPSGIYQEYFGVAMYGIQKARVFESGFGFGVSNTVVDSIVQDAFRISTGTAVSPDHLRVPFYLDMSNSVFDGGLAALAETSAWIKISQGGRTLADIQAHSGATNTPFYAGRDDEWMFINGVTGPLPYGGNFSVDFKYLPGVPISISMQLEAFGEVNSILGRPGGGSAQARADAARSLYWGGIQAFAADGSEITDFTVTSDSGTDWRQSFIPSAVPEPSAPVLFMIGLAAVGARALRRKPAQEPRSI